ncbi:MAG: D-alanine--D-alanine ligase [Bacillota bacterium]
MVRRIGVLMGGLSAEREVSLRSGRAVCAALESRGYEVVPIDVDRDVAQTIRETGIELAFIALHGPLGEDGAVQGLLELLGIPYTGSGVLASALAMDKIATKKMLAHAGLPVPEFRKVEAGDAEGVRAAVAGLGLPVVVKPLAQGSSLGVYIVDREEDVGVRIADAAAYGGPRVLLEKFIAGPELTAAVLGNRDPWVLPLIEIVSATGKYDYESKYTPGLSEHLIPPRVPREVQERVSDLALRAYLALGCRGFARVDLIVPGDEAYILEINTIPGLTDVSLFPDAARAAGMSFADLVERLVLLAQER